MSQKHIFQQSLLPPSVGFFDPSAEVQRIRAEVEALKFSEAVQKRRADEFEARIKILEAENQQAMNKLHDANQQIVSLVPVKEQHGIRCFATSWFFNVPIIIFLKISSISCIFEDKRASP